MSGLFKTRVYKRSIKYILSNTININARLFFSEKSTYAVGKRIKE